MPFKTPGKKTKIQPKPQDWYKSGERRDTEHLRAATRTTSMSPRCWPGRHNGPLCEVLTIDDGPAAGTEIDSNHGTSPGSRPESTGGREPAGVPPVGAFGSRGEPRHGPCARFGGSPACQRVPWAGFQPARGVGSQRINLSFS